MGLKLKEELKKISNAVDKNRYHLKGDYKIDRWIINIGMFLVFAYLLFVANSYNYDLDYYYCEAGTSETTLLLNGIESVNIAGLCKNPFYEPTTWKNQEYLGTGEYGAKLGNDFKAAGWVAIVILSLSLLLNHFIYNRKIKLSELFKGLKI